MGDSRPSSSGDPLSYSSNDTSIFPTRTLETFGRKVTATAGTLLGDQQHYQHALGEIQRELRHPLLQRNVWALSQMSPREAVRSKLSPTEIQHRALTYLPEELLENIPENNSPFSLFQGFQATLPDTENDKKRKRHSRRISRGRKLLEDEEKSASPTVANLRNEKSGLQHRLEMMGVRKNMCSTEIREIDNKIANLNNMRKIVLNRLADLEQEEVELEREIYDVDGRIETAQEEAEDAAALAGGQKTPTQSSEGGGADTPDSPGMEASFMSESIYEKLPSPKTGKRPRPGRRKTNFILHEHLQSGSKIREFQAHNDSISALDFDVPWGTMVTAALDDTVRVWDLNAGRCIGLLEGHLSSVRCLQVEDNIVATGSMDATVRLWDLSQADYAPQIDTHVNKSRLSTNSEDTDEDDDESAFIDAAEEPPTPPASNMRDCPLFTLSAHVAEVTALHFHNNTLISGSADKTLRQWDLEKGRCVQTLDVLWAAAQASSSVSASLNSPDSEPTLRPAGRLANASADFVGALQTFDAALACGTADGLVRLWDLRSGQVHRSLVGHTGPVTALQFDDVHLVTGSADRSIRIWDLRTGSIYDAFAYDNPITSMQFDARHIVAAAGEDVIKVYDKTDGRQWDCGLGASNDSGETIEKGVHAIVEKVRLKEGYMTEGRKDGVVGVWSC